VAFPTLPLGVLSLSDNEVLLFDLGGEGGAAGGLDRSPLVNGEAPLPLRHVFKACLQGLCSGL
jgi:hypothetical protein